MRAIIALLIIWNVVLTAHVIIQEKKLGLIWQYLDEICDTLRDALDKLKHGTKKKKTDECGQEL